MRQFYIAVLFGVLGIGISPFLYLYSNGAGALPYLSLALAMTAAFLFAVIWGRERFGSAEKRPPPAKSKWTFTMTYERNDK